MEAGEEESRCNSELVTMLHEEVILTNTPWRPGPVAAISAAPSPASHPPSSTQTPTHTHTPSHHHYHHSDSAFTYPHPTAASPACQSCSCSPPLSPTSIMHDMGVSSEQRRGKEPRAPPTPIPPSPGCDRAGGLPHAQGNYHTSFVAKCMGE